MNRREAFKVVAGAFVCTTIPSVAPAVEVGEFRFVQSPTDPTRSHGFQWTGTEWKLSCPCLDQGLPYCGGWINGRKK